MSCCFVFIVGLGLLWWLLFIIATVDATIPLPNDWPGVDEDLEDLPNE